MEVLSFYIGGKHVKPNWPRSPRPVQSSFLLVLPALVAGGAIGYVASDPQMTQSILYALKGQRQSCDIKGNINERGERIYHLPGDEYYSETVIDESRGERWFCSSWDAWWAGWRHARV